MPADIITGLLQESDKFIIILSRMAGLSLAPAFSARNTPAVWKISFVLMVSFFAWQMGIGRESSIPPSFAAFFLLIVGEFMIGIILSLAGQLFLASIQLAGQMIDTQMGFGIMNVIDPLSGIQAPIMGSFKFIFAMLVFLNVDGHHLFLQALFDSYLVIPIGGFSLQVAVIEFLVQIFGKVFVIACQLAFPIVGTLVVSDIILGIIARTVPQMNIFMVGMPAKILLGFIVLLVTLPSYIYLLNALIQNMIADLYQIIKVLA